MSEQMDFQPSRLRDTLDRAIKTARRVLKEKGLSESEIAAELNKSQRGR